MLAIDFPFCLFTKLKKQPFFSPLEIQTTEKKNKQTKKRAE